MNREQLTDIIGDGRRRGLSDGAIADAVLALAEADATWARAFSHPARGAILRIMRREGRLSPSRAARELEPTVGALAYHFRQLQRLGLIEVCDMIPRRGATEHVYRLRELVPAIAES